MNPLIFTHDRKIRPVLPGIQPNRKYVEIPVIIMMKFEENKIIYEHYTGTKHQY
jgi:carboxymethylenebutenolidase